MKESIVAALVCFALGGFLGLLMMDGLDNQLEIEAAHAAGEMK